MNIQLTHHAETKIAMRGLDREEVIRVAREPEQIVYPPDLPPLAQSRIREKGKLYLLRVAFRDQDDTRVVITVYKTSQVRRYWQGTP